MVKLDFKTINVEIVGDSPLLMNRLNPETLTSKGRRKTEAYSPEKDAAASAYMMEEDGKKELYIPMEAVYSMIINTSKAYRIKRMGVSSMLAGLMRIEPAKIPLGTDKYEVDTRAVVIQHQRVLKGRAMLPEWKAKFQIRYDAQRLPEGIESLLQEILEDSGTRMGLLDYRPQHKGWFGTFSVTQFEWEGKTAPAAAPEPEKEAKKKKSKA
jgi:hypothetical protein